MNFENTATSCAVARAELKAIKPIQVSFDGITYRSKTEARWAIFFKELGITALYEEEGFEIPIESGGKIRYLPDFHVPSQDRFPMDIYFEIKPSVAGGICLNEYDSKKITAFSNFKTIAVLGSISREANDLHGGFGGFEICGPNHGDCGYLFCQCIFCGAFGFEFNGRSERIKCCIMNGGHKDYNSDAPAIIHALDVASSYRFWK